MPQQSVNLCFSSDCRKENDAAAAKVAAANHEEDDDNDDDLNASSEPDAVDAKVETANRRWSKPELLPFTDKGGENFDKACR
jgi:hypothetical protein